MTQPAAPSRTKIAALIGGGGRLPAIYHGTQRASSRAELALVVSYKKESAGLEWAAQTGLAARYLRWAEWKRFGRSRAEYEAALAELLEEHAIELVVLAGWGLLLSPAFVERFANRIINVHPALLTDTFQPATTLADGRTIPVFRGNDAIEMALAAGVDTTGCTVHYVTAQMDTGPVLLRQEVAIRPGDNAQTLADRIHQVEDQILPQGIELACARLSANRTGQSAQA